MSIVIRILTGVLALAAWAFSLYVLIAGAMFGSHWLLQLMGFATLAFAIALSRAAWIGLWPWESK